MSFHLCPCCLSLYKRSYAQVIFTLTLFFIFIYGGLSIPLHGSIAPTPRTKLTLRSNIYIFSNNLTEQHLIHSLGDSSHSSLNQTSKFHVYIKDLFEESLSSLQVALPFKLGLGNNYFSRKEILQILRGANIDIDAKYIGGTGITLILKERPVLNRISTPISRNNEVSPSNILATPLTAVSLPSNPKRAKYVFYLKALIKGPFNAETLATLTDKKPLPVRIKRFHNGMALTFTGEILEFNANKLTFQTPFSRQSLQTPAKIGQNIFFEKK